MQANVPQKLSMAQVLACGAAVVTLSMGIRHGFGLWLQPITQAQGWTGLLWLSTVPATNATVAQIFGVAHLSILGGFVFFSHQIGSFMGVWLGGYLYDRTGSYDVVWYIAIALGIFAALVNLPVREAPISRRMPLAA